MATELKNVVRKIPHGVRANCYAFALAPPVGPGGFALRPNKAQPGEKCFGGSYVPLQLDDAEQSTFDLKMRILCDNPTTVKIAPPKYTPKILSHPLRGERLGQTHMMACISGKEDFHFCRRIYLETALTNTDKLQPLSDAQLAELLAGQRAGKRYVWVHQRGWSSVGHSVLNKERLNWRRRQGVSEENLHKFGAPTVVDASGRICWSPVPANANWRLCFTSKPPANNYKYSALDYDRFVGLFRVASRKATVFAGRNTVAKQPSRVDQITSRLQKLQVGGKESPHSKRFVPAPLRVKQMAASRASATRATWKSRSLSTWI